MADLEFPRLVHKGADKLKVANKAEFDKALADGYTAHADPPFGSPAAEGKVKAEPEPEAEPVVRRGPGRPPKVQE